LIDCDDRHANLLSFIPTSFAARSGSRRRVESTRRILELLGVKLFRPK
jgi:hypothetical protein